MSKYNGQEIVVTPESSKQNEIEAKRQAALKALYGGAYGVARFLPWIRYATDIADVSGWAPDSGEQSLQSLPGDIGDVMGITGDGMEGWLEMLAKDREQQIGHTRRFTVGRGKHRRRVAHKVTQGDVDDIRTIKKGLGKAFGTYAVLSDLYQTIPTWADMFMKVDDYRRTAGVSDTDKKAMEHWLPSTVPSMNESTYDILGFKVGGQFTFPTNKLVKNQKRISGNKKDMRINQFGNNNLKKPIKAQNGIKLNSFKPINNYMELDFSTNPEIDYANLSLNGESQEVTQEPLITEQPAQNTPLVVPKANSRTIVQSGVSKQENYSKYVGFNAFNKAYDEVEKEMPEAKQYRAFLTKIAQHESAFNASVQNKQGAPAYGYFQFMQDGKKWNNISKYSGLSIEEFRKNPKEQIKAAVRLAKAFQSQFSQEDINKARSQGITMSGMLGGAWLGGAGGVKKALNGIDSSDKHWSKDGKTGSSVIECFKRYNNL